MVCPNKGAGAPQPTGEIKMKKMILLVAVFGLTAAFTAQGADAKENWTTICLKCHGADGKGDTKMGQKLGCKDLTDAKVQEGFKDEAAIKALKEGLKSDDGKTLMKPFEQLSDDDIKALVAYVRTLKK
jgi:cytochrome c6